MVSIDKTPYYKNLDNYYFVEPKTTASVWHIVLDGDTLALLREWKKVQQSVV